MDTEVLKRIGLEQKEIDVYLALLRLGSITATAISHETRIERTLCYSVLEKLIDKGLVSYVLQKNVRYFHAADPATILDDLNERMREYSMLMPQLEGLQKLSKEETKVEVYKGKSGILTALKRILTTNKPYYAIGAVAEFDRLFPHFMKHSVKEVEKRKTKGKVLINRKEEMVSPQKYEEWRLIPNDIKTPTSMLIQGDVVMQFIWEKPYFGIVIENKSIAESNRNYFDWIWKDSKRVEYKR